MNDVVSEHVLFLGSCSMCVFDMTGGHWISIYVDDDGHYGEYFDSMGLASTRLSERYNNNNNTKIYNAHM